MHLKILKARDRFPCCKRQIGEFSGLFDKNNIPIRWGDYVLWEGKKHCAGLGDSGILLKNELGQPTIYYGMWYGDDKYDPNSYGKCCVVPADNGARMHITIRKGGR